MVLKTCELMGRGEKIRAWFSERKKNVKQKNRHKRNSLNSDKYTKLYLKWASKPVIMISIIKLKQLGLITVKDEWNS